MADNQIDNELFQLYPNAVNRWIESANNLGIQKMGMSRYTGGKVIGYVHPDGDIHNQADKKSKPTKMVAIQFVNSRVIMSEDDFKESKLEDIEKVMRVELGELGND